MVSVGTGCSPRSNSPRSTDENHRLLGGAVSRIFRALFVDGFIPRLIRAYMFSRSVHAQNSWDALMNHLEDHVRADHFRLNLLFDGEEPALDDVEQMPDLRRQVHAQLNAHNDCHAIARALWAAQFCFELDRVPEYRLGTFRCHGAILCRNLSSATLVCHLQTKFPAALFTLNMLDRESVLGGISTEHCCGHCGFFRAAVAFDVRHRDEPVHIFLKFNKLFRRNINGFPHPISWFEKQQELNYVFGRTHLRSRLGPRTCSCTSAARKRKRKVHFPDENPSKRQAF